VPKYTYTALDIKNRKVTGDVDAQDEGEFRKIMRGKNLVPLKFKVPDEVKVNYHLKTGEIAELCRQLSSMLSGGITEVRALQILKERDFKPGLKKILDKLHKSMQQGATLSEAMQQQRETFPEILIEVFASGKTGDWLANVCGKVAAYYDWEHKLSARIKSAMRYPKILAFTTLGVTLIILTAILPKFFATVGSFELPHITLAVIAISDFLVSYWYIALIAVLIAYAAIKGLLCISKVRLAFDRARLIVPMTGNLWRTIYTARFVGVLSSLYSCGVTLDRALEITTANVHNKYIESQLPGLMNDVSGGEPLSESVRRIKGLDKKLADTILVGEETGQLDAILQYAADTFCGEAETAASALAQYAEPLTLVVVALVIITIMLSVILPMASVYSIFGV